MAAPSPNGAVEAAETTFPPFDISTYTSQLFWLAISFTLLYFLLSRWLLPKIGSAIEERRDRIADDLDAAAEMKRQADEAVEAYEKALADARARAQAMAAQAKSEIDQEIDEEMAEADREAERRQADAEGRIKTLKAEAIKEVRAIAADAAGALATRLGDLQVEAGDVDKAVAEAAKTRPELRG